MLLLTMMLDAAGNDVPIVTTVPPTPLDAQDASLADDFIEMFPWANNCGCHDTLTCGCESPAPPDDSPSSTPSSSSPSTSDPSDVPKACDCAGCLAGLPPDMPDVSDEVIEKLKYIQRLGFQSDTPIEEMHEHADGIPIWTDDCPLACGHEAPSDDYVESDPVAAVPIAMKPPTERIELGPDPTYEYLEPGDRYMVNHLSRDQLRILWHQRLGHLHSRRVANMKDAADGIPKVPIATELDTCPICAHAKLRKANRGKTSTKRATTCRQGLSIDMGFMVQSSSADSNRKRRLMGLNGETCYCLISCHYSGEVFGGTFRSKAPPLAYLKKWLLHHGRDVKVQDKYVRLDPGGDLGGCREIVELFESAGYKVEVTAPDSSHMNGPVERPHQTIADAIRSMLAGADLEPKFWPYAFHHFIRLYNVTLHRGSDKTPYEICTGERPNLRHLRTFGCRVYAMPSRPRRNAKAVSDSRVGIFLGQFQS